jgi:hypothetical protein
MLARPKRVSGVFSHIDLKIFHVQSVRSDIAIASYCKVVKEYTFNRRGSSIMRRESLLW